MANESVVLWSANEINVIPKGLSAPAKLIDYAIQLNTRDKQQIAIGFKHETYEMAMSYVWAKSMVVLKRDLAKVGMTFLGELLGKSGFKDDANPTTSISDEEAITLARQLGVVSPTEGMRLRHAHEQLTHFVDIEGNDISEDESMERDEAVSGLKTCIKNILGKQKVEVATEFVAFRTSLEQKLFKTDDQQIQNLLISPYFFKKVTLGILLNLARTSKGAQLENALANLNVILPLIWPVVRDVEKWLVGNAYSVAYSEGAQTASAGLKSALLKVKGFDYVPENVRSHTFIRAAEKIIETHEAINNFYNEPAPVQELRSLGSTIPIPAFASCAAAVLCVKLGNPYGVSVRAQPDATAILKTFTRERWAYYLNECLPGDSRIIAKLGYEKQRARFMKLAEEFDFSSLALKGRSKKLVEAASPEQASKFEAVVEQIRKDFYGKS